MYKALYNLSTSNKLRGSNWMPPPWWLKTILAKYPVQTRIVIYSRMLSGQQVFVNVPAEVGCANAVSGLLEMVDPSFFGSKEVVNRIDSTIRLAQEMERNPRFVRVTTPHNGCIIINRTVSDKNRGHTGIYDNGRIWNNNSFTGKWATSYRWDQWRQTFQVEKGLPTEIYFPLGNK